MWVVVSSSVPHFLHSGSRGASQSEVRSRWLTLCTLWPSHSQITTLSTAILAFGKARRRREPNLGCRGADRPGWSDALKKLHESCRMCWFIFVMKLVCSPDNFKCDCQMKQKPSQQRFTADWLTPRESECLRMRSKVCSDWLPSYMKVTRPVLERFIMDGCFPDSLLIQPTRTARHDTLLLHIT
jgi:hypothetical protein